MLQPTPADDPPAHVLEPDMNAFIAILVFACMLAPSPNPEAR